VAPGNIAFTAAKYIKGGGLKMGELQNLPNIGEELELQLNKAGIDTINELKKVGSKNAWLRILAFDPSACIMRLSALEGAIRGVR
jgi:DNA transformation protein